MKPTILLVDDESAFLSSVSYSLRTQGFDDITAFSDPIQASLCVQQRSFDLAFLDITMPKLNGIELLEIIKEHSPGTECIMITANESIPLVIRAIKAGAYDYLVKPIEPEQLHHSMTRALERKQFLDVAVARSSIRDDDWFEQPKAFENIVTCEPQMLHLLREAELHAKSDIPVLITGETGVGKELMARALHEASPRRNGPFVAINMLSLSLGLFESALFGHAKGAFTGATEAQTGYLEQAQGGTLFLDEIGDLPLEIQGKLLRVLQEKEFTPVGKTRPRQADVRFLAATHCDLEQLVVQGTFRKDLFFRLRFAHLHIPPLRQRKDDIQMLTQLFLQHSIRPSTQLSSSALAALLRHEWPGNIRELKGSLEAAVNLAHEGILEAKHLKLLAPTTSSPSSDSLPALDGIEPMAEVERRHILRVYEALEQNKTHTAKALGLSLPTLHRKLKAYHVK